jgi:hypothetical protein
VYLSLKPGVIPDIWSLAAAGYPFFCYMKKGQAKPAFIPFSSISKKGIRFYGFFILNREKTAIWDKKAIIESLLELLQKEDPIARKTTFLLHNTMNNQNKMGISPPIIKMKALQIPRRS